MPMIPTVPCTSPYSCGDNPSPPLWPASMRNSSETFDSSPSGMRKNTINSTAKTTCSLVKNVWNVSKKPSHTVRASI